ncbi:hypothetical protein HHA02_10780 [Cobetia marina]|nr:hypothetical protein HHA02_10780 [Cobetia marina]
MSGSTLQYGLDNPEYQANATRNRCTEPDGSCLTNGDASHYHHHRQAPKRYSQIPHVTVAPKATSKTEQTQ